MIKQLTAESGSRKWDLLWSRYRIKNLNACGHIFEGLLIIYAINNNMMETQAHTYIKKHRKRKYTHRQIDTWTHTHTHTHTHTLRLWKQSFSQIDVLPQAHTNTSVDIHMYLFIQPLCHEQGVTQGHFLSKIELILNSELSFSLIGCLTETNEPSLTNYLHLTWGRMYGFMLFPSILALSKMQTVPSGILNSGHRFHFLQ